MCGTGPDTHEALEALGSLVGLATSTPLPLGEVTFTCRPGYAPSRLVLFPGARVECFLFPPPPPLPAHCLWDSSSVPGSPGEAGAPSQAPRPTRLFPIWTPCISAPSDHSRLFDGTNDDLGLQGLRPPQTEINPASFQTRGLQPRSLCPSSRQDEEGRCLWEPLLERPRETGREEFLQGSQRVPPLTGGIGSLRES